MEGVALASPQWAETVVLILEGVLYWIHVCCAVVEGMAELSVSFAHLAVVVFLDLVAFYGDDHCGEPVGVALLDLSTDVAGHSAEAVVVVHPVVSGHSSGAVVSADLAGAVASGCSAEAVVCAHSAVAVAASGGGCGADGHGLAARVFDQES